MKPTYEELIQLNPYLENKNKKDVEELIEAILECGYEWNEEHGGFWHPKIQQGIKTSGLDMFDAERLKKHTMKRGAIQNGKKSKKPLFFLLNYFS